MGISLLSYTKKMKIFLIICFLVVILGYNFVSANYCDCDYHPGGCTISQAPPEGWKCKCRYKGFWTCDGPPYNVIPMRLVLVTVTLMSVVSVVGETVKDTF